MIVEGGINPYGEAYRKIRVLFDGFPKLCEFI